MLWHELSETLLACIDGVTLSGTAFSETAGVYVTAVALEMPLEVSGSVHAGKPVFLAIPPHTRWVSGVLPAVHRATMRVVLDESGGDN